MWGGGGVEGRAGCVGFSVEIWGVVGPGGGGGQSEGEGVGKVMVKEWKAKAKARSVRRIGDGLRLRLGSHPSIIALGIGGKYL